MPTEAAGQAAVECDDNKLLDARLAYHTEQRGKVEFTE